MQKLPVIRFIVIIAIILFASGLVLSACGQPDEPAPGPTTKPTTSPAPTEKKVYKLSFQSIANPGGAMFDNFNDVLIKWIHDMSNGEIEITHTGSASIVPNLELHTAIAEGVVDMGYTVSLYWAQTMPIAQIQYTFPGMYTNKFDLLEAQDRGLQEVYRAAYADQMGVHFIIEGVESPLDLCTKKPVNSLDDLKGMKIRAGGALGDMLAEVGGAAVVMMPGGDIYTSMQTGVIEGFSFANLYTADLFGILETAKYAIKPSIVPCHGGGLYLMNNDAWDSLPHHLQEIITIACWNYGKSMTTWSPPTYETEQKFVNELGGQFTSLPESDIKKMGDWAIKRMEELAGEDKYVAQALDVLRPLMENR